MKYKTTGKVLRDLRQERNWSLDQFIKKTGIPVSRQYLNTAESGKTKLALKYYAQICKAISIDPDLFKQAYLIDMGNHFDIKLEESNS